MRKSSAVYGNQRAVKTPCYAVICWVLTVADRSEIVILTSTFFRAAISIEKSLSLRSIRNR